MLKKKLYTFLLVIFSICLIFTSCNGEITFVGDSDDNSVASGSFASSGLAAELSSSSSVQIGVGEGLPSQGNQILNQNRASVLEVYSFVSDSYSSGSGVIIGFTKNQNSNGGIAYILTCHHVIEYAHSVNVKDIYGKTYGAGLIGSDPIQDIAVLWANVDYNVSVASFGNSDDVLVGEKVYAIGNTIGTLGGTVTEGVISYKNREMTSYEGVQKLLQISAPVNRGNSGGGVFTTDGYLIGIVNSGIEYQDGLGFALPSNTALDIANQLISTYKDTTYNSYGYVQGRFIFGCEYYYDGGMFVTAVYGSGLASYVIEEDYLRVNDVLISYQINDGEVIDIVDYQSIFNMLETAKAGDKLTINYARQAQSYWINGSITYDIPQYIYVPASMPEQV